MNEPYPFGSGNIRLLYSEQANTASPILLGTRALVPSESTHIFATSDLVKAQLEMEIARSRCMDDRVHPTSLELRAAVCSITFFECVAAQYEGRWGTPKVIEHDNWHRIYWTFIRLFESGNAFIAKWEDRYSYNKELWEQQPQYSVSDLCAKSLENDCGKSYLTPAGDVVLEYVDKI